MREELQALAQVPGVVGALACGPGGELLDSQFPPLFAGAPLQQAAALFAEERTGLRRLVGPDGNLDLRFARGRVVARPFAGGTLVVVGTAAVDVQLLALSLEQAARRLDAASTPAAPPAAQPGAPAPQAGPRSVPPEVARARAALLEVLLEQIGPVAEMILAEAWSAWLASGPPSKARMPGLVEVLAREVDDAPDRARFVAAAQAAIR